MANRQERLDAEATRLCGIPVIGRIRTICVDPKVLEVTVTEGNHARARRNREPIQIGYNPAKQKKVGDKGYMRVDEAVNQGLVDEGEITTPNVPIYHG